MGIADREKTGQGAERRGWLRFGVLAVLLLGILLQAARPAAAQEPTAQPLSYVVQPGDTLYNIAQRFGTTVKAIADANGILDPALIEAGQRLRIPGAESGAAESAPSVYVVRSGDTLFDIARRFGTTVRAITNANEIADPSLLEVGQRLVIPVGSEPEAATQSTRRVHVVRSGETLPFLAFRYGVTTWALRGANNLDWLGLLLPGQELEIPAASVPGSAAPRPPWVRTAPGQVTQGQTLLISAGSPGELTLSGRFLGQDLLFQPGADGYWALAGVDPLMSPGEYAITLEATDQETGDRLTIDKPISVLAGTFATVNIAVPEDRMGLLDPGLSGAERKKVAQVFGQTTSRQLWQGVFGYPLAGGLTTTAGFGQRRSYAGGPVSSYHAGQDLDAETGAPVYAPAAGTVVLAETLQVRGNAIILDHGLGVFTGFWHLSEIDVTVGQSVARGDLLGRVGNTGLSTGSHLHWEMQVHGIPVDALQWTRQAFP
jgi:murein DD-endopeptidase MepM/ murein hydrolase activator NlpD